MKNIELSIPSMQSSHCQTRVNGAIAAIEGIKVEKLEAGKLSVAVESDEVKEALVATIEKANLFRQKMWSGSLQMILMKPVSK